MGFLSPRVLPWEGLYEGGLGIRLGCGNRLRQRAPGGALERRLVVAVVFELAQRYLAGGEQDHFEFGSVGVQAARPAVMLAPCL